MLMTEELAAPATVSREEWLAALDTHRAKEKALTEKLDALAAERRRLPRERVEDQYTFDTPEGAKSLLDLFDGRSQLIVYHHMLKPGDRDPCTGCCMFGDQIPHLAHLHARDTSLVFVARAPLDEIEALSARLGWRFPFVSTGETFNHHFGVTTGFGLNVFLQEAGTIYRTYFTTGRGAESLGTPWAFLDLTPYGRQESWQDAPPGTPQGPPYEWWRLNDEYIATP
jgi:predicted dithiol-disulfide oxidoreductase (DUF899 family)